MSPVKRWRREIIPDATGIALAVTLIAIVSGHPAVAEVVGGAVIIWFAILAGSSIAPRVVAESDPGRVLLWDLLLVLVVVLGLAGVGVMALAIP